MGEEASQHFQFALVKYEADRAHELEVEKVSAQIEIAFIQAVVILNGVSATAYLSFFGSNYGELAKRGLQGSFSALVVWGAGLLFGLAAGAVAYRAQGNFARASRYRRHASGIALIGSADPLILGLTPGESIENMLAKSNERQVGGTWQMRAVTALGFLSIVLLFVGVTVAARGIFPST